MRRHRDRRRLPALAAVAVVAAAAGIIAYATDALRPLELNSIDARFHLRADRGAPRHVVLVALDGRTLRELSLRPPLPRSLHARVIARLHAAAARVIAYDLQFIGPTEPRQDAALSRAVSTARPVILGTHEADGRPVPVPAGEPDPARLGAVLASVGVLNDSDNKIRRMLYAPVALKSFDVAAAELYRGGHVSERHFPGNVAWIDYPGPPGTVRTVSLVDVLAGRVPANTFRGKVVVVGATDPIEKDVFPTPVSDRVMSGPEIHADSIATILAGFPLTPVAGAVDVVLIALCAFAAPLAALRRSAPLTIVTAIGALVALAVGAQLAFDAGRIVVVTYPALAIVVSGAGAAAVDYLGERRERRRLRMIFARFVPGDVVDDVIERTDEDLRLGGVRREGTVMFADLRGFTSFAEALAPERVVEVINRYLSEMTDAILGRRGTLVSYMGDGIMALFGAPLEQPDHADRALAAAREMVGPRLARFNAWLHEQGFEHQFRMGVGINSGEVMSGNVGSESRIEYTAIGDTTNTAARLEGMTKGLGCQLLVADSTRASLSEPAADLEFVDDLPVRGRQTTIRVWTLRDPD